MFFIHLVWKSLLWKSYFVYTGELRKERNLTNVLNKRMPCSTQSRLFYGPVERK
jgi:hypothetical protein